MTKRQIVNKELIQITIRYVTTRKISIEKLIGDERFKLGHIVH